MLSLTEVAMCNLYSITTNQAVIAALFHVVNRYVGNLAPMPGIFPDADGPASVPKCTEGAFNKLRTAVRQREPRKRGGRRCRNPYMTLGSPQVVHRGRERVNSSS